MIENIFIKNLPTIDLHGYDRESARVKTKDFIDENILMGKDQFVIIHGIGEGVVKESVYEILKKDKRVFQYKMDVFNQGCTIVWLKLD